MLARVGAFALMVAACGDATGADPFGAAGSAGSDDAGGEAGAAPTTGGTAGSALGGSSGSAPQGGVAQGGAGNGGTSQGGSAPGGRGGEGGDAEGGEPPEGGAGGAPCEPVDATGTITVPASMNVGTVIRDGETLTMGSTVIEFDCAGATSSGCRPANAAPGVGNGRVGLEFEPVITAEAFAGSLMRTLGSLGLGIAGNRIGRTLNLTAPDDLRIRETVSDAGFEVSGFSGAVFCP